MAKQQDSSSSKSLTWGQMIGSTLAATFGVQSRENRERDFSRGEFGKFVVVAVGFTGVLLVTLLCIVQVVISQS